MYHGTLFDVFKKVCDYLELSKHRVLAHWACLRLKSPGAKKLTDAELEKLIVDKARVAIASA